MTEFAPLERRLLDAVQAAVPLCERPFVALAEALGSPSCTRQSPALPAVTETEVIAALRSLRDRGVIRQIGPIFDSAALGFRSALLAFAVAADRVATAAAVLSAHPGVSHNYERAHPVYRLWSTLTVPPGADLMAEAATLARAAGTAGHLCLTAVRTHKIAVRFVMNPRWHPRWHGHLARVSAGDPDGQQVQSECGPTRAPDPGCPTTTELRTNTGKMPVPPQGLLSMPPLTPAERRVAAALECDLALEPRPFDALAARAGVPVADFLATAQSLLVTGHMRRYAAVLRHAHAGYAWNAMTVWRVEPGRAAEAARILAACDAVSHCYERTTAPDWPYTHYAMLHARTVDEGEALVAALASRVPADDWAALRSVREFKKERVLYFADGE